MSSKVASYLRSHLIGDVVTRSDIRESLSNDFGILHITPELVVYPKSTNDIRKVARFSWQLAEKGHVLPLTVRGAGTGTSGGAVGNGVSIVTTAKMNRIFEYDPKQQLVRIQPGATLTSLEQSLALYGSGIAQFAGLYPFGTVGGAIGDGAAGFMTGKYGRLESVIDKLEVVLANGDVLQTGRISKRELNRKKGLPGFEGDIYRGVDAILDDYADVFDSLRVDDATGYNAIADIREKDGSIDLTPLFVGSQGTLGIISEMILKTELLNAHLGVAAIIYPTVESARDALDPLCELKPAFIEYFDARLFETAATYGKTYEFYQQAVNNNPAQAVVLVGFDDFNERHRNKYLKRVEKIAEKTGGYITVRDKDGSADLLAALDVISYATHPDNKGGIAPDIYNDFQVPAERFEDFLKGLKELEQKVRLDLPLSGHVFTGVYAIHPSFQLSKVSDKQKIFKIFDELTKLVTAYGGSMVSGSGEGRLKAHFVYSRLDDRLLEMYKAVRDVFDPRGTLNPGVKQNTDLRKLAEMLHSDNPRATMARLG